MSQLEKEIKNYQILACMIVRATGSVHGEHPRRCLWDICGKPMIQWALEPVIQCKYIDKVVVCTEDRQIRDVVEKLGVKVIDRPLFQSHDYPRDYTSGLFRQFKTRSIIRQPPIVYTATAEYVLYWLEKEEKWTPDIYLCYQANMPMSSVKTTNRLIETFFKDKEATEARTFYHKSYYAWMINPTTNRLMPLFDLIPFNRQLYPKLYCPGPYILLGCAERSSSPGSRIATVYIEPEEGLDIHTEEDLFKARCYMKRRLLKEGKGVKWEIGQDDKFGENNKKEKKI